LLDSRLLYASYKKIDSVKERGRNNFPNYTSQLQATFARSQITKVDGIAGYFDIFVI